MFTLRDEYEYEWPVDVRIPSSTKPGAFDTQRCHVTFRVASIDEARAEVEQIDAGEPVDGLVRQSEIMSRYVTGWRDIKDIDGNDVPFSDQALKTAMQIPYFAGALVAAYTDSLSGAGAEKRRRGN